MRNIVLLFLVIVLIKLTFLFIPPINGFWTILNTIGIISIFFIIGLLFHIKKEDLTKGFKYSVFLTFIIFTAFTFITWKSYYSLIALQTESITTSHITSNERALKETAYSTFFKVLEIYNNQKTPKIKNLQACFESLNSRDKIDKKKLSTFFYNPKLMIYISGIRENEINLVLLDKNHIGRLPGFINFGDGLGFYQYHAKLTLGGISYEREN